MGLEVAGLRMGPVQELKNRTQVNGPSAEQPSRVIPGLNMKAAAIAAESQKQDRKEAERYLNDILDIAQVFNRKLKFSINEEIDRIVVKVIDKETDKVIKEIPPVELQHLYARMKEAIGLIVDEKI
jgi:uncharacterized FlaG/YvyC family protein